MKNKYLVGAVLMVLFLIVNSKLTKAEEGGAGFSIEYQVGGTQIDRSKGFYYLATKPGEEQEIVAKVMSSQEDEVKVKLSAVNAYTQANGEIGYTDNLKINDKSLLNPITSMVSFPEPEVTIKKYETKLVKIKIKAPEKHYEGVKAGGIVFTKVNDDKMNTGVGTVFSYRIGLMTSESGDAYNDSKTLKLLEAKAHAKKGKKIISGILQNPEPKILSGLNMKGIIIEKVSGKAIKEKKVENYKMAPNSNVALDFDWGIEKLPAGEYVMKIEAQNPSESWNLSTNFSISGEEARKINEESPYQLITPMWLKIVSSILGLSSLVVISFIIKRQKKREKAWKKLSIDKKSKKKKRRR